MITDDNSITDSHRLVVTSIGKAVPSSAVSVATGLGVPVPKVVEAFYRAPTTLVDNIDKETATNLKGLLAELGYESLVQNKDEPELKPKSLLDVAVYIKDTNDYTSIVKDLSEFIGTNLEETAKLISTPPGIILGSVSENTVEALEQRLSDGVEIIASDPKKAIYDVYLSDCEAVVTQRIVNDLKQQGYRLLSEEGCLVAGITQQEANNIWQDHRKSSAIRIINRDFMRFDLVLTELLTESLTEDQNLLLAKEVGIPEDIIPKVIGALPITLYEGLPHAEVEEKLLKFNEAGMLLRADMITFMQLGLEIIQVKSYRNVSKTLSDLGVLKSGEMLNKVPFRLPYHMPELQARLLRDSLVHQGAETIFVEASL